MKIAPTGDIFDQPPGQMRWIRVKIADHVGNHVVLSPERAVVVTSPGTKSSYPRPPQSLDPSGTHIARRIVVWSNRVRLPIPLVVSLSGKLIFPFPRSCLRIWPRQTGSAVPSRVSQLTSSNLSHIYYVIINNGESVTFHYILTGTAQ